MAYYILKSYKLNIAPFRIFEALKEKKQLFFLDSSLNGNYFLGRYSFLGAEPFLITEGKDSSFKKLRRSLQLYSMPGLKNEIPFLGGAVGYLAYDSGLGIPRYLFGFYNTLIIIDHPKKKLHLFSCGFPEKRFHLARLLAQENFGKIYNLLKRINSKKSKEKINNYTAGSPGQLKSNFTKEEYIAAIKKAKEYIRRGDIYQVNLSQQFRAETKLSSFEIYRRLRKISPAYFNAYLDCGNFQILSSSPELFLKVRGRTVISRPMKGTRPRGESRAKDLRLRKELLESRKDSAELVMIVDLERNDLGRVCAYDSINVDKLREIEAYNTVFQATSSVSGELHKDKDRIDLLRASFPGGSITGCPKIRAMEVIKELEPGCRSVYTGSLGFLSFSGDMELNILIRTILKKEDMLYFGAGGGIVADSEPLKEYEETLVKAKAMIEAINENISFL